MKSKQSFSTRSRISSFSYAFSGLKFLIRMEHNMWIHLVIGLLVILCSFYLSLSGVEWALIILCIGMVLAAEAINTSIEHLCDRITTDEDQMVKRIKDVSASAVLISSITAAVIGILLLGPKLLLLF